MLAFGVLTNTDTLLSSLYRLVHPFLCSLLSNLLGIYNKYILVGLVNGRSYTNIFKNGLNTWTKNYA